MGWDFSTDADFAAQLEWMRRFVDDEIEPLSLFYDDMSDDAWKRQEMIAESSVEIRALRLMALHSAWVWDNEGASKARVEIAELKFWARASCTT